MRHWHSKYPNNYSSLYTLSALVQWGGFISKAFKPKNFAESNSFTLNKNKINKGKWAFKQRGALFDFSF